VAAIESAKRRRITLGPHSLVGRAAHALVTLTAPGASSEHASIVWHEDAGVWRIRDLASTNGTWLEGEDLAARGAVELRAGATLTFGCPSEVWTLVDDGPPVAAAQALRGGERRVGDAGLLVLSTSSCVFTDELGWRLDQAGESSAVHDQQIVRADGQKWRLELPPAAPIVPPTWKLRALEVVGAALRFAISRDQESVELTLTSGGRVVPLGARTHHYVLHLLACERERERARAELPVAEQGWIHLSELARRVGDTPEHINVAIWRARQALRQAGFADANAIVERRPRSGLLRIGGGAWSWGEGGAPGVGTDAAARAASEHPPRRSV
jgi:hypothetical protein